MKQIVVLVPMKGHSERVPNKNMKLFGGRPLYHAIMSALQNSKRVAKIIINTDSEVISEDATKYFNKVQINWRPQELQGDFVSMNDIINYDVAHTPGCEHFMQTHSTNPLLTTETIDNAIDTYFSIIDKEYDSLFGVTKFQSRFYWKDANPINHNPDELLRTQDLPPIYEENSNLYIFSRDSFIAGNNKRIGRKPYLFPIDKLEAIDIDDAQDFIMAETLYKTKK